MACRYGMGYEGIRFETCLKVRHQGGSVSAGEGYLELQNVRNAVLLIVSNSSWYFDDYRMQNKKELQALEGMDVQSLLDAHVSDHRRLFDRVAEALQDSLPTDARLNRIKEGYIDPGPT
jgi:alpha-L-fucosidase 2